MELWIFLLVYLCVFSSIHHVCNSNIDLYFLPESNYSNIIGASNISNDTYSIYVTKVHVDSYRPMKDVAVRCYWMSMVIWTIIDGFSILCYWDWHCQAYKSVCVNKEGQMLFIFVAFRCPNEGNVPTWRIYVISIALLHLIFEMTSSHR